MEELDKELRRYQLLEKEDVDEDVWKEATVLQSDGKEVKFIRIIWGYLFKKTNCRWI